MEETEGWKEEGRESQQGQASLGGKQLIWFQL